MSKLEILQKPIWSYRDVMVFAQCKENKAYKLIARAQREFDGSVPYGSGFAKSDSILAIFGTTRLKELEIANALSEKTPQN